MVSDKVVYFLEPEQRTRRWVMTELCTSLRAGAENNKMGNDRVVYILEQEFLSVSVCTAVFSLKFPFQERCTHHSSCQCCCHQVSQPECCACVCVHLFKGL